LTENWIGSVAPVLLAAASVTTIIWNASRESGALRRLERFSTVLEHLDDDSLSHAVLRDVTHRLALRVALLAEAPKRPGLAIAGWFLLISGLAGAAFWLIFGAIEFHPPAFRDPVYWLTYGLGLILGLTGQGLLLIRAAKTKAWTNQRLEDYSEHPARILEGLRSSHRPHVLE
jgi:hypothetical protein